LSVLAVHPAFADAVKLRPLGALYADAQEVGLSSPGDVACGDGESIWVADTGNGRLLALKLEADGPVPGGIVAAPELSRPLRVAPGPSASLYVLDGKQRRLGRVDLDGRFLGWIDPSGPQGTGRTVLRSFTVDTAGQLYLLDVASARVLVTDPQGAVERSIAFPETYGFVSDVAVDRRGSVFALDSVEARLLWAAQGEERLVPLTESMTEDMDFPTDLTIDSAGRIFVSDQHGGGIVILGTDGAFRGRQSAMGWRPGLLRYPCGLCVTSSGDLFVADRGNDRVQVFRVLE
jgi:sugar lactone lactonase YvrE